MRALQLAVCPRAKTLQTALQVCCKVFVAMRQEMVVLEAWAATIACGSADDVRAQTKSDNVAARPDDEQAIPVWMQVHQAPQRRAR